MQSSLAAVPTALARTIEHELKAHPKAWLAIFLAWAAGFVDVVGWMAVYHVYVTHMTGNTAGMAHVLVMGTWGRALEQGWPLVPFLAGLLYSAAATKAARRRGFHASFSIALITELVLLIVALVVQIHGYLLLSLLAGAMGIQTVTVTRINGLRVYTTYLTGSLAKFSEAVVDFAFWFRDRTRGRVYQRLLRVLRVSCRQKSLQHAALLAGLWIGFFVGAICGAVAEGKFGLLALVAPMIVVAIAVMIDLRWPVAAADEPAERWSAH